MLHANKLIGAEAFASIRLDFLSKTRCLKARCKSMSGTPLTHFDDSGASRMVDVGDKPVTARLARAEAIVVMQPSTLQLIHNRELAKGDVLEVARLAGIMACKRTDELIPLCHSLGIDSARIEFDVPDESSIRIEATIQVHGKTGVEMEALLAVSIAALTIYDMAKGVDRAMEIRQVRLIEKSGGKSGHFRREVDSPTADNIPPD